MCSDLVADASDLNVPPAHFVHTQLFPALRNSPRSQGHTVGALVGMDVVSGCLLLLGCLNSIINNLLLPAFFGCFGVDLSDFLGKSFQIAVGYFFLKNNVQIPKCKKKAFVERQKSLNSMEGKVGSTNDLIEAGNAGSSTQLVIAAEEKNRGVWHCALCTKENGPDDEKCVVCGRVNTWKPERAKHVSRTANKYYLPFHPKCAKFPYATRMEYKEFQALLEAGVSPNDADSEGWTGLHWASALGRVDLVKLFAKHEVNLDAQRYDMWTALHIACQSGHSEVVHALLALGADMELTTNEGKTPMHVSIIILFS